MNHQILMDLASAAAGACLDVVIRRVLAARSPTGKRNLYNRGYVHASSSLLTGEATPDSLLDLANNPFHQNEFDEGIKQAVWDFTRQGNRS
jgi:hypothetical protein